MGKLLVRLIHFFNLNRKVYFALLSLLVLVTFFGFSRLKLNDDIFSVFPKSDDYQFFTKVIEDNKLNKRIVFSIDSIDENSVKNLDSISTYIQNRTNEYLSNFKIYFGNNETEMFDYLYRNFPVLVSDFDYHHIENKIEEDSIKVRMALIKEQLSSLNGLFLREYLTKDPLGVTWSKLKELSSEIKSTNYLVEDGLLWSKSKDKLFFTAKTKFGLNRSKENLKLEEILENIRIEYLKQGIVLNYFSPFLISNANSIQVKKDTKFVIILSIFLIILILVLYYQSVIIPLLFIIPVIVSSSLSIAVIGLLGVELSVISLAISAIILGIVMDYSFHFFTHYAKTGDVYVTVKELFNPMLIGSFTTIAAFVSLLFTNSLILQNFGLIALLTLSFAVIITLVFLPVLVLILSVNIKVNSFRFKVNTPSWVARVALFLTLGLTVLFIIDQPTIQFDSDLNNLSYHPDRLVELEKSYTGLDPILEKKIMIFVKTTTLEEAVIINHDLYQKLSNLKADSGIHEIVSIAPFVVPRKIRNQRNKDWIQFWSQFKESTKKNIRNGAKEQGLEINSFHAFTTWISDTIEYNDSEIGKSLELFGLSEFLDETDSSVSIVTTIVTSKNKLEAIKDKIRSVPNVYIFDTSEFASSLVKSVQEDFNYLILFSSLVVFISLFLIYGRIELALFSFFPMAVSWVWIIYLANWLDIQFNFVNIIIATIIFGLGDDFSIFITDGLIQEYKNKSTNLKAYKSAIILSALTTIVGTGVLIFAKHPAINSIAILSVSGIASILLITLIVQPLIFKIFITNRIEKKLSPITFLGALSSTVFYLCFIIGCLLLNVIILLLYFVPAKKIKKRYVINFLIFKMTGSIIYIAFHLRKRYKNLDKLDFSKPSILIANHVSFLDILLTLRLHPKIIIIVNDWVYKSPLFGRVVKHAGFIYIRDNPIENLDIVKRRIAEGYSIMIFPEGTRNPKGEIKRFKKGAFYLAQELKVDIQPIIFTGTELINPKGDLIIKSGKITVNVLDRISYNDSIYGQTPRIMSKEINGLMRLSLENFRSKDYDTKLYGRRILYNYLYKGIVLEVYFMIKWRLEERNFEFYDKIIGEKRIIYDLGCGYGYLGFYLHYRDKNRKIIGFDYDENKIEVAQNGYDKNENLNFYHKNIKSIDIIEADVVILTDVLHYLRIKERELLIENISKNLNVGGMLIIRDGVREIKDRHKVTMRSERYSTKYMKFNKVENKLEYISIKEIEEYAEKYNFSFEIKDNSKTMSNVIIILRKQ